MNTVRTLNKEIENIRKYQTEVTELKNAVTDLKKYTRGVQQQWHKVEEWISDVGTQGNKTPPDKAAERKKEFIK